MNFTPPTLDRIGMAKFMKYFDNRVHAPKQKKILQCQHTVSQITGKIVPMQDREYKCRQHDADPYENAGPSKQGAHDKLCTLQKTIRIQQRKAHCHGRSEIPQQTTSPQTRMPLVEIRDIRRYIRLQHICAMKLREKKNYLVLGWHIITEPRAGRLPYLPQGALTVHESDNEIGLRRKSVELPC